ncbi:MULTISPECIES: hypothetical protein [Bacillus]|uniref:Uncharacterized protein n=1 Tax=Bacillus infantis NRRL B-14911 TaxID=1367477 RepID=U5L992_9BACI|nr:MULTISPECIES: hypothetical protein [Bacillus]AGX03973.1 hypothetical protein N288_10285 [Bacillus infantis NRRL B-14911]
MHSQMLASARNIFIRNGRLLAAYLFWLEKKIDMRFLVKWGIVQAVFE